MTENKEFNTANEVENVNFKGGVFVFFLSFVSALVFMAIALTNGLILDDFANYNLFERELQASLLVAFVAGGIAGIEGMFKKKKVGSLSYKEV